MSMYDAANLQKIKTLKEKAPEAMKAFFAFDAEVFKDGALSAKMKEIIAVAVAVTTQCAYCIDVHTKKAKAAGATDEELVEAALVSAAIRAGGSITHATHCL